MNKQQRIMLRATGWTLFILGLAFNIIIMPNAHDITMADNICNAKIELAGYEIELGLVTQMALNNQEKCTHIHFLRLGIDYAWISLALGSIMFFIGVWAGLGVKGKREMLNK